MLTLDASVLVKSVVDEGDRAPVRAVLLGDPDWVAPAFSRVEVANVLWKKVVRGSLSPDQARRAQQVLDRSDLLLIDDFALNARALDLALALRHPVYDCLYLACAERFETALVTADRRLADAAGRAGVPVSLVTAGGQ